MDNAAQSSQQVIGQDDIVGVQQVLIQNTKVLAKLQEVLRKDNRDIAIISEAQDKSGLALMIA